MFIPKLIAYLLFDCLTIYIPILVACGLKVENSVILAFGILLRATICAWIDIVIPPNDTGSGGENGEAYEGITFKEKI